MRTNTKSPKSSPSLNGELPPVAKALTEAERKHITTKVPCDFSAWRKRSK